MKDVGSAERLARATIRQPFANGTRNSNQTTRQPDIVSDTSRDACNDGRLLLPVRTPTIDRIRRWPGPPQNKPDDQRRRNTNTTKESIQNPRTIIQQQLRQEKRPTIPR